MKPFKTAALLIATLTLFLGGCATVQHMTMEESVCVNRPAEFKEQPSHICDVSWQLQIPPEETDSLLLDASAMAYVVNAIDKQTIAHFLDRTEASLTLTCANLSFNDVLENISTDAEKSLLLTRVLNRRLRFYASPQFIGKFDCWMMHKAITHQREQFGLFSQDE